MAKKIQFRLFNHMINFSRAIINRNWSKKSNRSSCLHRAWHRVSGVRLGIWTAEIWITNLNARNSRK